MKKIFSKITQLKIQYIAPEYAEFKQISEILTEELEEFQTAAKVAGHVKHGFFKQRTYHIEVWDKNRIDTFLLGDYVSCCLATDGENYEAIIERRIDNGLFFIVVIDDTNNEPVALDWLYYGADNKNSNSIYVVANFIEIRANLGRKEALRKAILLKLLDFTHEFSIKIKATGFVLHELNLYRYSDFKHDLDFLPTIQLEVTKVGGFFQPSSGYEFSYYLKSLKHTQFWRYAPKSASDNLGSSIEYQQVEQNTQNNSERSSSATLCR